MISYEDVSFNSHPSLDSTTRLRLLITLCSGPTLAALAVFLKPAIASIRSSFSLEYCSWRATDIMLAEVAPGVDVFSVIESWKGRLQLGNRDAPWESWRSLPQLNDPSGPDLAEDLQSLGSTSTGTGGFAEICAERLVQADIISTVGNVRQNAPIRN
jgi:hypothetical protein